jgi:hypothetical protein
MIQSWHAHASEQTFANIVAQRVAFKLIHRIAGVVFGAWRQQSQTQMRADHGILVWMRKKSVLRCLSESIDGWTKRAGTESVNEENHDLKRRLETQENKCHLLQRKNDELKQDFQSLFRIAHRSSDTTDKLAAASVQDFEAKLADMQMNYEASSREAARLKLFTINLEDELAKTRMDMANVKRQHQAETLHCIKLNPFMIDQPLCLDWQSCLGMLRLPSSRLLWLNAPIRCKRWH